MQYVICFISTATKEFSDKEIENLLSQWRDKNSEKKIRGILLFSEGHFFQVLEGEKKNVLALFEKIRKDQRHTSVIQVLGKDLDQGSFDDYIVENLKEPSHSKAHLVEEYCESVKGMDPQTQRQIKVILKSFIDTQVL